MADMSDVTDLKRLPLDEIEAAHSKIRNSVLRTPLVLFNHDFEGRKIYLKLENLQTVGSFKIRGACNAIHNIPPSQLEKGTYTCSAGNFAQGLAWNAQRLGVPCTIVTPNNAPQTKIEAIERYGASVIKVPYTLWWETMTSHHYEGLSGHFVHPVCNRHVIAGNGTIGLEILEDCPEVDTVIGPFGGGGLLCGIASAIKAKKPDVQIIASEVETAAPLTASFQSKKPTAVQNHKTSFVDGMGGKSVFKEMWNLASTLIDTTSVLSLGEISEAIRLLVNRNHIVAEGAGAAPLASALSDRMQGLGENIVCVVSGGNIDSMVLTTILQGKTPGAE